MDVEEIKNKGYDEVGQNLYKKDGKLYVQQGGELKDASGIGESKLAVLGVNIGVYKAEIEKLKGQTSKDSDKYSNDHDVKKNLLKKINKKQQMKTTNENINVPKNEIMLSTRADAYDIINVKDDEQVLAEIEGRFMQEFVYNFSTKEGKVTGLSWAGTKEIARQQGNISVEDLDISETPETYRVKAKAKDTRRNVSMFGVAEQSKVMHLKSGDVKEDLHALSKCVSRAQRNAIRALIPEMFIKEMIDQFLSKKHTN